MLANEGRTSELLAIAGTHFLDGNMDAAAKMYELCASIDPTMEHTFYRLGVVRARERKWEEAKNAFQTAAGLNPQWSTAWFRLANAFSKIGSAAEGKRAFLRGRAVIFGETVREDATAARLQHFIAGRVLRDETDFAGAEAEFRAAIKADPEFALAWSYLGSVLSQLHRLPEALEAYQKAAALDPDSPEIRLGLGLTLREQDDFSGAEAELRAAIKIDPEFSIGWSYLGSLLRESKRLSEAKAAYGIAAKIGPITKELRFGIGRVLQDEGNLTGAETEFRAALEIDPDFEEAWAYLGRVLRTLGRLQEAVAAYNKSIQLNPKPETLAGLGLTLRDTGDLPGAEAQFNEAVKADPGFALGWTYLANVRSRQNKLALAFEADEKAVGLSPNNPNIQFGFGCAAMAIGKLRVAKTAFERVVELNPTHLLAQKRLSTVIKRLSQTDEVPD